MTKQFRSSTPGGRYKAGDGKKYSVEDGVLTLPDKAANELNDLLKGGQRPDLCQRFRELNEKEEARALAVWHRQQQQSRSRGVAGTMTAGRLSQLMNEPQRLMMAAQQGLTSVPPIHEADPATLEALGVDLKAEEQKAAQQDLFHPSKVQQPQKSSDQDQKHPQPPSKN